MNSRLFFQSMILVGFVFGCTENTVDPIVAAPPNIQSQLTFKAFVKNEGVSELTEPLEISGTAQHHFNAMADVELEPLLSPTRELDMRMQATLTTSDAETCIGEVCCQGCQTFSFTEKPSHKLKRQFALPAIAADAILVVEFYVSQEGVTFSHASIERRP